MHISPWLKVCSLNKTKKNIVNKHQWRLFQIKINQDIDKNFTTTHSKEVIKLIKNKIKFKNLLISDDISMKSLKFSIKENTIKAFKAGCDLVLHCNGKYKEMLLVAKNSPLLSDFVVKKTSQLMNIIR